MSHSLVKQINHIVFATKGRRALISPEMRDELYNNIGGILRAQNCRLIKAGGRPAQSPRLQEDWADAIS